MFRENSRVVILAGVGRSLVKDMVGRIRDYD